MFFKFFSKVIFLIIILTLYSCQKENQKEVYTEIVVASPLEAPFMNGNPHAGLMPPSANAPSKDMPLDMIADAPVPNLSLNWTTPAGWIEKKGDGLRLATFESGEGSERIECSIVTLSGMAGGNQANIARWMQQIHLPIPSEQELNLFLEQQEKFETQGGWRGTFIDFTTLQPNQPDNTESMLAAIVEVEGQSLFVKMTGTKAAVLKNKNDFLSLSRSLQMKK